MIRLLFGILCPVLAAIASYVIGLLSALLTPLIAAIAAYIAYQQHVTNRRQYRLALFEKRLPVFNTTVKFMAAVMQAGNVQLTDLTKLLQETREHDFLFGPEIGTFINDVYDRGVELHAQNADNAPTTELMNWFSRRMAEAKQRFKPYMDFTEP